MATKKSKKKKTQAKASGFTFQSKNGNEKSTIETPSGCKAQQVVLGVLNAGDIPEGLDLRYAKSYGAHFVAQKGKNALGFFDTKDVLVVNAIAEDLEKEGVKGIIKPSKSKNFKAIRLTEVPEKDLGALISKIARVLGFTGSSKSKDSKKKEKADGAAAATA
jgi:hypothetical protein